MLPFSQDSRIPSEVRDAQRNVVGSKLVQSLAMKLGRRVSQLFHYGSELQEQATKCVFTITAGLAGLEIYPDLN
jgi:hypothetical protein